MSWGIVASVGVGLLSANQSSKAAKAQANASKQEMDPAMRPYVFGDANQKGLLSYGADQLARSQSPERMQGWNNMMNRGQQLMGGSVAGNPFSSGYQGGSSFGRVGGGGSSLSPSQIYAMASDQSAQGFSNQDIATGAQKYGITADELSGAYAQARPELFAEPGSAKTMADYTRTLFPSGYTGMGNGLGQYTPQAIPMAAPAPPPAAAPQMTMDEMMAEWQRRQQQQQWLQFWNGELLGAGTGGDSSGPGAGPDGDGTGSDGPGGVGNGGGGTGDGDGGSGAW